MRVREIYDAALAFLGEKEGTHIEYDFERRAGYIIAEAVTMLKGLDRDLRRSSGEEDHEYPGGDANGMPRDSLLFAEPVVYSMDNDFPLCDVLAHPAALFVSAMLMVNQNQDLYEYFYGLWSAETARITASIPAECTGTKDNYPVW